MLIASTSEFAAVYGSTTQGSFFHGKTATIFKVKKASLYHLECFYSSEVKSLLDPNGPMLDSTRITLKSMGLCQTPVICLHRIQQQ